MQMVSTIVAVLTVTALAVFHWRICRHPGWRQSADGRFWVTLGYPMIAIGVYWLATAPTGTDWEWALGNAWVLAACVSVVYGIDALGAVPRQQGRTARSLETIAEPHLTRPHTLVARPGHDRR
jgi:hypothetical protein